MCLQIHVFLCHKCSLAFPCVVTEFMPSYQVEHPPGQCVRRPDEFSPDFFKIPFEDIYTVTDAAAAHYAKLQESHDEV